MLVSLLEDKSMNGEMISKINPNIIRKIPTTTDKRLGSSVLSN